MLCVCFTNAHWERCVCFLKSSLSLAGLCLDVQSPQHLCPSICLAFASARGDDTHEIKCDGWMCEEELRSVFTECAAGRVAFAVLRLLSLAWLWAKHNVEQQVRLVFSVRRGKGGPCLQLEEPLEPIWPTQSCQLALPGSRSPGPLTKSQSRVALPPELLSAGDGRD